MSAANIPVVRMMRPFFTIQGFLKIGHQWHRKMKWWAQPDKGNNTLENNDAVQMFKNILEQ